MNNIRSYFRTLISELFSELFRKIFASSKKPDISEKFPNFENRTIPKLAKTKSSEIFVFRRALKWTLITNISDHKTNFFFLKVFHGGSVLDPNLEVSVRKSDVTTFRGAFESIMRAHYPTLVGHVVIKCVPCPGICSEALAVLSSLSPYRFVPIEEFCMFAFVTEATFFGFIFEYSGFQPFLTCGTLIWF